MPRILVEAVNIKVLGQLAINPTMSTRQKANETGLSQITVVRALKCDKFYPYKMNIVQKLGDDDLDRRIEFCENIIHQIIANLQFL
ncbi:hypothetical protein RN001_006062 [Aquatica leii]|uniref:Uncharacterized protein n=1 Tax=Aquatica leii TaxID=1421715 RepID=A0AAN7PDK3_9COLE|nr:hypothetical protein RN001_006062 [Aquatica leii]